jgi:deoxyribonuclease V
MRPPFACLDAAYSNSAAAAACVLFAAWDAAAPLHVLTARRAAAAAYEPGAFYKRELPLLLAVLEQLEHPPGILVVDGYAWLDGEARPGLGAMLYRELAERVPVVGVAKSAFAGASACIPVSRGGSRRPLFVSAAGMEAAAAAGGVQSMHGPHRIPTLLQLADHAARAALT